MKASDTRLLNHEKILSDPLFVHNLPVYAELQIHVEASDQLQVALNVSPGHLIPIEIAWLKATEKVQLIHVFHGPVLMCVVEELEDTVDGSS